MRGDLHPILGVPAFLLAMALSMPIYAWIDAKVPGPRDSPAMLFPYLCCAFLPAAALTFGVAAAIQSTFERAGERVVEHAIEAAGGPPARRRPPFQLPFALERHHVMYLCAATALACIAFAAWPRQVTRRPEPAGVDASDPASRARSLARDAVVRRLSVAGIDGMTFDARQASVGGRRVWRVTTRGGVAAYVVDVGEGTRKNSWGQLEPVVDVYAPGAAPLEDAEAPEAPAPVSSG